MINLNDDTAPWTGLLAAATENAITNFEVEFCESLRQKLEKFGAHARLTEAQHHKLTCIAQAGGFWERDQ
jgi:hypothetical protein